MKIYSNSQVLGYGHLPEKWCKRVDFYKILSLGGSARDCGFASKRPWPALEGSWLARDEVQGLGVELWSGCSRVVVVEVLVMGVIRPPPRVVSGSSGAGAPEWSWVRSWSRVQSDLPTSGFWELWSGCSRVVVGEVLVAGAIRPPHEWTLGVSGCSRPPSKLLCFCFMLLTQALKSIYVYFQSNIAFCKLTLQPSFVNALA